MAHLFLLNKFTRRWSGDTPIRYLHGISYGIRIFSLDDGNFQAWAFIFGPSFADLRANYKMKAFADFWSRWSSISSLSEFARTLELPSFVYYAIRDRSILLLSYFCFLASYRMHITADFAPLPVFLRVCLLQSGVCPDLAPFSVYLNFFCSS